VLSSARLLVDLSPLEGLHARVAWAPDDHQLWVGLAVSIVGLEVGATGGGDRRAFGDTAQGGVELTVRGRPAESLVSPHGRTIELPLQGKLRRTAGLLSTAEPISPVPLALIGLAGDPTVSKVVLSIGDLEVSSAEIDELRAAIRLLRAQGKTVIAELAGGSEKEYLVAAACDRIRLDPAASLVLDGYSVTLVYLADTLAKVGVRVDAVGIGRYKTAPDQLTRTSSRPEEREVQNGILAQLYASFVDALVKDRKLKPAVVEEVVARALVTPAEALKLGLVDELSQPADPKQLPIVRDTGEALDLAGKPSRRWSTPPVIAVVPVVGNITASGAAGVLPGGAAEAGRVVRALDELRRDREVRAVVMRIDSPGGEVYASEVIWRAARLLAAEKPLVVSMGAVAASGGYYVAAPAHVILAEPSTITGSIGIFMIKPDLSGLVKLAGAHAEALEVGPHAGWSSPLRGLTEQEKAIAHEGLAVEYEAFLQRVSEGRRLPLDKVRTIAEGRVYTGQQALAVGLVDGIGGMAEAIAEAQLRAGLSPDTEVEVRIQHEPLSLGNLVGTLSRAGASPVDAVVDSLARLESLAALPLARLPFEVMVR
jgi:protease-4